MGTLVRHQANASEIVEITNLLKRYGLEKLEYHFNDSHGQGYILGYIKKMQVQFIERENIMYFSLQINLDSYDVTMPEGELLEILTKVLQRGKDNVLHGATLAEKISANLIS